MKITGKRVGVSSLVFAALASLYAFEDTILQAYQDSGGTWTIGTGLIEDVKEGDIITQEENKERVNAHISKDEIALRKCIKAPLYQHEWDAYLHFTYNVGASAFCNSTLVKKLNAYDYDGACEQLKRWVYVKGKDCRIRSNNCYGLVLRREAEYKMCKGEQE